MLKSLGGKLAKKYLTCSWGDCVTNVYTLFGCDQKWRREFDDGMFEGKGEGIVESGKSPLGRFDEIVGS